ncbi:helix-turn-helix domain-containing protein [Agarivorans sp. 1_MG-2023]|uniref:helix-turn-helix domain-containing protein n=1 Tax=Agarivorans sp. 1_MG-2023 TaxID=3062634 RepID=UPI0026E23664|nr:helix-turn-helix domain-containing protein [Agarivorans sp. 1_MG-2023]MDO6765335.1 helix-turn-helix domain-containing protein [Agarivorans sp. 1_MG-2023]
MNEVDQRFRFSLFRPKGRLADTIQALWSASLDGQSAGSMTRWLQADGCSGVLFNLGPPLRLDGKQYEAGMIILPVSKVARSITLPAKAQLAGFRFLPGVSTGFFGTLPRNTNDSIDPQRNHQLQLLCQQLQELRGQQSRIIVMYKWLQHSLSAVDSPPQSFTQAINFMQYAKDIGLLSNKVALSQRQLERHFQHLMGMTPKQWQRTLRVKMTLKALKNQPTVDLAELALSQGFSDQAHMTRECKSIAKITPKQYLILVLSA